jgi:hypothetical protein
MASSPPGRGTVIIGSVVVGGWSSFPLDVVVVVVE